MNELDDFFSKMERYQSTEDRGDDSAIAHKVPEIAAVKPKYDVAFWQDINNKGFLVYEHEGNFFLQKYATPMNSKTFDVEEYSSMIDVEDRIDTFMSFVPKKKFVATAMYNRGLGEEYQTCEVDSVDDVQAKIDAMDVFYNEHKLSGIELQIKIRPRK